MCSRTLQTVLASLVACFAGSACDPVRTGEYAGTYPAALQVDLAQAPDLAAIVAQPGGRLVVGMKTWWFQPARTWAYLGHLTASSEVSISPSGLAVDAWPHLAGALGAGTHDDPVDRTLTIALLELMAYPPSSALDSGTAQPALVAADLAHVLLVATADMDVALLGPAGPTVHVPRGFHVFERTCTPDGPFTFAEVPTNTVSQPVQLGWMSSAAAQASMDLNFAVTSCGIGTPPTDLGAVAAPIPHSLTTPPDVPQSVGAMAWSPASEDLYLAVQRGIFMGPWNAEWIEDVHVDHLGVGQSTTSPVTSTKLLGPLSLTVATAGTSLLLWTEYGDRWQYVRQSLTNSLAPSQAQLPDGCCSHPSAPNTTVLSPDGNLLASVTPSGNLSLTDILSLSSSMLALPAPYRCADGCTVVPRAFAPAGTALLLEMWNFNNPEHTFATVTIDLTPGQPASVGELSLLPATGLPAVLGRGTSTADAAVRYFWSASGPQALIQDAQGARVTNLITQLQSLLVEPSRVATAATTIDVVVATDQAFAWAVQCFGLGETSCRAELRRLSLATGAIDIVASGTKPWVFAVSPDGERIAFADDTSLYLKTIAR
jgi:hypothetical protein